MKKRVAALCLALALALTCAASALAAGGFNSSVLKKGRDVFVIDEDSSDTKASYVIQSMLETDRYYHYADDGILVFSPCVGEVDGHAVMSLCVLAFLDKAPFPEGINIRGLSLDIAGTRYTFTNLTDREIPLEGIRDDALAEGSFAMLDASSLSIMDALNKNRDKTVTVHVTGETKVWDFTLAQAEVDSIIHLYNLYVQAGGLSSENLKWLPAGSGSKLESVSIAKK